VALLVQLNLKVPGTVRAHWQAQASAAGLSVRDWLISQTMPGEPLAPSEPPMAAGLVDRLAELERKVAELVALAPA
jgi:hypothetical protein